MRGFWGIVAASVIAGLILWFITQGLSEMPHLDMWLWGAYIIFWIASFAVIGLSYKDYINHGFKNVDKYEQGRRIAGKLASRDKIVRIIPTRSMLFLVTAETDDGRSVKVYRPIRDDNNIYVDGAWLMKSEWGIIGLRKAYCETAAERLIMDDTVQGGSYMGTIDYCEIVLSIAAKSRERRW